MRKLTPYNKCTRKLIVKTCSVVVHLHRQRTWANCSQVCVFLNTCFNINTSIITTRPRVGNEIFAFYFFWHRILGWLGNNCYFDLKILSENELGDYWLSKYYFKHKMVSCFDACVFHLPKQVVYIASKVYTPWDFYVNLLYVS